MQLTIKSIAIAMLSASAVQCAPITTSDPSSASINTQYGSFSCGNSNGGYSCVYEPHPLIKRFMPDLSRYGSQTCGTFSDVFTCVHEPSKSLRKRAETEEEFKDSDSWVYKTGFTPSGGYSFGYYPPTKIVSPLKKRSPISEDSNSWKYSCGIHDNKLSCGYEPALKKRSIEDAGFNGGSLGCGTNDGVYSCKLTAPTAGATSKLLKRSFNDVPVSAELKCGGDSNEFGCKVKTEY